MKSGRQLHRGTSHSLIPNPSPRGRRAESVLPCPRGDGPRVRVVDEKRASIASRRIALPHPQPFSPREKGAMLNASNIRSRGQAPRTRIGAGLPDRRRGDRAVGIASGQRASALTFLSAIDEIETGPGFWLLAYMTTWGVSRFAQPAPRLDRNCSGRMIGRENRPASTSRSRSPVTRQPALPATASWRNGTSYGSRHSGVFGGAGGMRTVSQNGR